MITVAGWPRSGTHWMKAMLEYALGEELTHAHSYQEEENGQYVLMIRDPRDAFASHWRLYQKDHPGEKTERGFVEFFLEGKGMHQHNLNIGWVAHTRKLIEWHGRDPRHVALVRYERLYAAPRITLVKTLVGIGRRDILRWRIFRAKRLTRRRRCDPSDLPVDGNMGRPGKWRGQLQPETVRALLAYCGKLMIELGYKIGKET